MSIVLSKEEHLKMKIAISKAIPNEMLWAREKLMLHAGQSLFESLLDYNPELKKEKDLKDIYDKIKNGQE